MAKGEVYVKEEVIGTANVGAFLHKNNGGKVNISAYTSVNEPLKVDSADVTEKIAEKEYLIIEREKKKLEGSKFYSKDIWNEQHDKGGERYQTSPTGSSQSADPEGKWNNSPGMDNDFKTWVKNTYDNMARDLQAHKNTVLIIAVALALVAAAAFVKAFFG